MAFATNTDKMFPANHKTIFVLDHTPYFGISCESPIEFEFLKTRTPTYMVSPIAKSLWTSSLESSIEYCRIVWDLFPSGKLVRFIASDTAANIINTWAPNEQNLSHIMNGMSFIGVPPSLAPVRAPAADYTILHGLRNAAEAATEYTELQMEKSQIEGLNVVNRCRVICITSARDNDSMKRLEEIFLGVLIQQNVLAAESDRLLKIDHCHLVIINTFPVNIESQVNNHPPTNLSPILTTEVHSIRAPLIPNKLSTLILEHYNLASTTVTGIPMKEEQNASSSANYDVEIYHASDAHTSILKGNASDSAACKTVKEGHEYETVTLKWCTPRGCSGSEMQNCTSMHRITPCDVNSRPSLCLINFLLNGRSVMLEMPRKAGGKITSHLLAAHGGEIFIHTLCTARSVLEDPPSISEGVGGRVTDYRITDFGLLIKQNTLLPIKANSAQEGVTLIQKMKTRLSRHTRYWPLTISSTVIFNLKQYIDPLPSLITKEEITDDEVYTCKKVIYNLISLESKMEPLYPLNSGQRMKSAKREEQYKAMWSELETLLKNNSHTENHKKVYNCLVECHKFNFDDDKSEKVELDDALRELDQLGTTKSDPDVGRASVIRATTDSPMSPPPLATITPSFSRSVSRSSGVYSAQRTLLDIFTAQDKSKTRPDFFGRMSSDGLVAKLYPNLQGEDRGPRGEEITIFGKGNASETVTLKWCTPRGCSGSEMQNCISMHRITPCDVNSRPSLCLINFLLNGRSVMLEMPRKAGGKITSHLLAAHGGEIFIHTLCTARSVLEDPPSISEGVGGRVTDYRITDFGLLIKQNTLLPIKANSAQEGVTLIQKMKTRLSRHTRYWPLTISSTVIFNLKQYIDPLPSLITKEEITDDEVYTCKKVIYNLISLESKMEPLYPLNSGQRMKSAKREEQYKAMWSELETLLKNNSHTENHKKVYNCLVECHKFNFDDDKSEKVELDNALRELDQLGTTKSDPDVGRASVIRATTDSPMSPPPLATITPSFSRSVSRSSGVYSAQRTLLDIFTAQDKSKTRPDFFGRMSSDGLVAKLYPNLQGEDRGPRGEGMEVE